MNPKRPLKWLRERVLGSELLTVLKDLRTAAADEALERLRASPRQQEPGRLIPRGFKAYSQGDEDGIIQEVFRRIGSDSRRFLEIGVEEGLENNSLYLLLQGWEGTWVEADPAHAAAIRTRFAAFLASGRLRLVAERAEPDAMARLLTEAGRGRELDLLSIDVDGNDQHLLAAVEARPRLIVMEYNAKLRPPLRWTLPYDPAHRWDGSDRFGASLSALQELAEAKGYRLVGCGASGSNAFFVRADLVGESFCAPFTAENHYEPARYWLVRGMVPGHPAGVDPRDWT